MVIAGQQKLAILFIHPPPPPPLKKKIYLKTEFYQGLQITAAIFPWYLIISSNVQQNRQALMGLYSGQRCVQGEFPHGDPHSIASQVSQSQNPLSICHHDRLIKQILWFT